MKEFVVKELVKGEESKPFPQEQFTRFDPYVEYYLLEKVHKHVSLVRKIQNKLVVIDLKSATPGNNIVEEEFFDTYMDNKHMLIQIPYYTGGVDQAFASEQEIRTARKEFFQWLIDEGYFD